MIPRRTTTVLISTLMVLSLLIGTFAFASAQTPTAGGQKAQWDAFKNFDASKCYIPKASDTPKIKAPAIKAPPYRIAISNSYIGNDWRTEMIQSVKAYAERPEVKPLIKELYVVSSGTDAAAQIAIIDLMIAAKYDAILIDSASETALNPAIKRAHDAGIVVASFDNVDNSPYSVRVNQDGFQIGKMWADWLVEQLKGEGNVFMVTGVTGVPEDTRRVGGAHSVFDKTPGIKILGEQPGQWANGPAQAVMATALGAYPKIDGVWCEGGDFGVVKAFQDAGKPFVPIAGEAENGFRKLAKENNIPIISIGNAPPMAAVALKVVIDMLKDGAEVPQDIILPPPTAKSPDLVDGRDFFSAQPDTLFVAIQIPACNIQFTADDLLAQNPY
jgi:ribose transport system substrate-binding protein